MPRPIKDLAKSIKSTDDLIPFPEVFAEQLSEIVDGPLEPPHDIQCGEFVSASGIVMLTRSPSKETAE